jgi:hypothetical protein
LLAQYQPLRDSISHILAKGRNINHENIIDNAIVHRDAVIGLKKGYANEFQSWVMGAILM